MPIIEDVPSDLIKTTFLMNEVNGIALTESNKLKKNR